MVRPRFSIVHLLASGSKLGCKYERPFRSVMGSDTGDLLICIYVPEAESIIGSATDEHSAIGTPEEGAGGLREIPLESEGHSCRGIPEADMAVGIAGGQGFAVGGGGKSGDTTFANENTPNLCSCGKVPDHQIAIFGDAGDLGSSGKQGYAGDGGVMG